jgi:multicomponent Na+:H+ antiporter subunit G
MNIIFELIAIVAVIIGTTFSVIGVIGNYRLPEVYTRLHALGKVSTFGVVLLLIAVAFTLPQTLSFALVMIVLLLCLGPVVSHALGSAAWRTGVKMKDVLKEKEEGR